MKRILLILIIALLPLGVQATSRTHAKQNVASMADEAYKAADYATAIEHYESVLADGLASADLYYNLGNAYYRTGQMGRAILNYERALRLDPGMSDARENLALAENHTVDRIAVLPKLFIVRWVDSLCTHLSPTAWRIVWLVLLALLGLSVVAFRLGATRGLRKAGFITGVLLLLLLLTATWLLLRTTHRYNSHSEAVVMPAAITVKSSPEGQSTDKLILHEGTRLTISDSLEGWYKVTIADGTTGWCQSTDVERI